MRRWSGKIDMRKVLATLLFATLVQMISDVVSENVLSAGVRRAISIPMLVVISGCVVALLVLALRRAHQGEPVTTAVDTPLPQLRWDPAPSTLFGRDDEVREAVERAAAHGVVAIVGQADIGTSAIGAEVVRRLPVDEHYRLDMRSRSSERPEEVRVVASRLLGSFGLDVPARDDEASLKDAAHRLYDHLAGRRTVLFLDEVSLPEQVGWLLVGGRDTTVVIAGEQAVAEAVRTDEAVHVSPLSTEDGARMLLAELGREPVDDNEKRMIHRLAAACLGRPRAIRDVAIQLKGDWTVAELAAAIESTEDTPGHVFRVRVAVLAKIRETLSPHAIRLMDALASLPVTELPPAAVATLAPSGDAALRELVDRDLVRYVPPGRYRMPLEVRWAIRQSVRAGSVRGRPLARLARYYADLAEARALELTAPDTVARASQWFQAEEALLLELVRHPAPFPDVCRIADALDGWHGREQRTADLLAVADALAAAAERENDAGVRALAAVRRSTALRMAGRADAATAGLAEADAKKVPAVAARAQLAWALLHLERSDPDSLQTAERTLRRSLELLPHGDLAGQACVRINLGVVRLRQHQPVKAAEHLARAAELATDAGDWAGRAHAVELLGVASWRRGRYPEAVNRWKQALGLYRELGEDVGAARCLAHLGSAALSGGEVAGLVRDDTPRALDWAEAAAVAQPLLLESLWLRAGQPADAPGTTLVKGYLAEAARRGGHPGLTSFRPAP
ncbi:tetratricopeptide repeat protein [Lentzea tibetensis]|uniref:Tetratricopeptide repeat protein n=1 Tax=Lentzea tibetensis TaxID=2591470 RepID=A0A563EK03_9PSEU|nr:tetratricopeptide repeat protein [Lentzea tibetensis]TWP47385.1 tetratricopeptide repeat protein [Lentzea tibetensis]